MPTTDHLAISPTDRRVAALLKLAREYHAGRIGHPNIQQHLHELGKSCDDAQLADVAKRFSEAVASRKSPPPRKAVRRFGEMPKLKVPDVRQKPNLCGPAVVRTALRFFSKPEGQFLEAELDATEADGTDPGSVVKALSRRGLVAHASENLSLDDLADAIQRRLLPIAVVQMYGTMNERVSGHASNCRCECCGRLPNRLAFTHEGKWYIPSNRIIRFSEIRNPRRTYRAADGRYYPTTARLLPQRAR